MKVEIQAGFEQSAKLQNIKTETLQHALPSRPQYYISKSVEKKKFKNWT